MHVARKHKLIDENPFSEVKIPTANVSARQRFIDRDTVQKLLDVANPTWRTIIALCRFGGLRCPSEVLSLEWRHVDWERNRITVPSPKTDRYDGKGSRTIPLFAELRPYLEEAFELAEPGQTHVVGGEHLAKAQGPNGWRNCNLRTTFEKLVKRAGLEPWPRLFHNLRSSRETELLEVVPGPRRRAVDGTRRQGELEALRPDDRGALRPGGRRRRKRRTRGAKSGAADRRGNGSESHESTANPELDADFCDSYAIRNYLLQRDLAEGEGFEPSVGCPAGFQDRCDRPLCHPSG